MANPGFSKSVIAEAIIPPFRVLKWGSADGQVLVATNAADALMGLSDSLGQDAINNRVDIILDKIADAEAGAPFARGTRLTTDALGRVVPAAAAAGTNIRTIGTACATATAIGEIVPIYVERGSFQG